MSQETVTPYRTKIAFVGVDPENLTSVRGRPIEGESGERLREIVYSFDSDPAATAKYRRIGIIVVGGPLDLFQFDPTSPLRARGLDGLAVQFLENVTLPPARQYGARPPLAEWWTDLTAFYQVHQLVKSFVRGVEQQLVRRVIAIGMQDGRDATAWLAVPLTEEERFHGRVLDDDELLELINFLWVFNPLRQGQRRSADELANMIAKSNYYNVPVERVMTTIERSDALVRERKRERGSFDKAVIARIIPNYRGEDPPG